MVTDDAGERWPLVTNGPPLTERPYDPDAEGAAIAFVSAVAKALDTDPLALSTLNDRIDPDYVDPLLAEVPIDPPEDVRAAVEVSLVDVSGLLRDDTRIEVYPAGREPNRLVPAPVVQHDWSSTEPLLWSIGRAIAAASEEEPATVTERLVEGLDADAVNRLLRPLGDGSERRDSRLLLSVEGYEVAIDSGGSITVEPSLEALRRSGAALLLVGTVPEQGFDRVSATLLGDPDEGRSLVFVLHGREIEAARRRLSMAGSSPSAGTVLDHRATARSTSSATAEETEPDDQAPEVVPVSGGLEALPEAVRETIGDANAHSPGELRLCIDSLGSMIDSNDVETTRDVIEPICRMVREHRGIGSFLLPIDADSEAVEALAPLFDVVVELRTGDVGVEQRWRLTGTGHVTSWFPVG